jgi:hypothetical protein
MSRCSVLGGTALLLVACAAPAPVQPTDPSLAAPTTDPTPQPPPAPPAEPGAADQDSLQRAVATAVIADDAEALGRLALPTALVEELCGADAGPIVAALEIATATDGRQFEGVASRIFSIGKSGPLEYAVGELLPVPGGGRCALTRAVTLVYGHVGLEHSRGEVTSLGAIDTTALVVDDRWYLFTGMRLHRLAAWDSFAVTAEPDAACLAFAGRHDLLRGTKSPAYELCAAHDVASAECALRATNADGLDHCARLIGRTGCEDVLADLDGMTPEEQREDYAAVREEELDSCAESVNEAQKFCIFVADTLAEATHCFDPIR